MYNSLWFQNLNKPFLNPPSWVFQPVWIVLYILMAVSLVLFVSTPSLYRKTSGYIFFAVQLILNLAWSPIFFAMQNIALAFLIIVALDIFVILLIRKFYSVSKLSAYLLIPYLIWIIFATYLNAAYWILN